VKDLTIQFGHKSLIFCLSDMIPAPMGRPQDFFPGVGKLEGLGMEVSRRTQRRSPGGVWWRSWRHVSKIMHKQIRRLLRLGQH